MPGLDRTDSVVQWIADCRDQIPTPLYLYNERSLQECVRALRGLFPDETQLFYSLKANPQPGIVRYLASQGVRAEIASAGEREMCALAGVAPEHILVGGVCKSEEFLTQVYKSEPAGIVVESVSEWRRLKQVARAPYRVRILLRVNPGVSFGGIDMAGDSQFGLSPDQAITIAKESSASSAVDFLGLHFYFGSQRLKSEPIVQMISLVTDMLRVFCEAGTKLSVIDVGLGCGVPYLAKDSALDFVSLGRELQPFWTSEPWYSLEIWSEAGRALVASSGYFIARVTERKELHGKVFIFLDGGLNTHNPGVGLGRVFRSNPRFYFITQKRSEPTESVDIVGNLCTSADCIGRAINAPNLQEGDLVVIPNSGAYCQTTGLWGFNSQPLFSEGMLTCQGTLQMFECQATALAGVS